ncbi:MAG: hypothetical protein HY819_01915 [Acidobacteria bacterium]|nr:hypothetical protein [Acidobacteriota bacterium]
MAVNTFAEYDIVVFGDGLEFQDIVQNRFPPGAGFQEHENTRKIINLLKESNRRTLVYGYIDLGNSQNLPLQEIENRARLWANMGVSGIFLDEAGYDFGVTRTRQNSVIKIIHNLGLQAFLNAYNLEDLFDAQVVPLNKVGGGNPSGEPTILSNNDLVLLESFQIRNGEYDDSYPSKLSKAIKYKEKFNVKFLAITTILPNQVFNQAQYDYAWWSATLFGIDALAWGEVNFSSSNNLLPKRTTPILPKDGLGERFISDIVKKKSLFLRKTNKGKISIDVENHRGFFKEKAKQDTQE